jgi:hypothetical protein
MLNLDDPRWTSLAGGYRTPYDPRPALAKLQSGRDSLAVWEELWNELHHQGDVDLASYAALPHLVRIYKEHPLKDYNSYTMVAVIELARNRGKNPDVPSWLADGYFDSIQELATVGMHELTQSSDPELVRAVLGVLALAKGLRTYARFLLENSEEELLDLEARALSSRSQTRP